MAGYPCKRCGRPILIGYKTPGALLPKLCPLCREPKKEKPTRG